MRTSEREGKVLVGKDRAVRKKAMQRSFIGHPQAWGVSPEVIGHFNPLTPASKAVDKNEPN